MKKTNKIIIGVILVAVLLLGVGYAAIQNVTLNIAGTVKADPSQSNFNVKFSGTPTVSDASKVTAAVTDDINATINVASLTTVGENVTATYTVQNTSTDLSADLSVATTNSNEEYFTVKAELAKTSLVAGEATTVTVTVTLTKASISESVSGTVGVQLVATPVEPGKEGTTGGTGTSQSPSTLALVTNDDIGDYIDLGNSYVGTTATTDDWRILYVEDDTVYAILADCLPVSQVPTIEGIDKGTEYSIYSDDGGEKLLKGLKDSTSWSSFANGITGATAIGAPTAELLLNSYNTKNKTELVYTDSPVLDSSTQDYNLYITHTDIVDDCNGYWLATEFEEFPDYLYYARYTGRVTYTDVYSHTGTKYAARPVVSLPATTAATQEGEIWTVSK